MPNQIKAAAAAGGAFPERLLERFGATFDFDAGSASHDYRVAIGTQGGESIGGTGARDYLWGMRGNDLLAGGIENDNLYGDLGADVLTGGAGEDLLVGGQGDDRLFGGAEPDGLRGGAGNDYLDEGAGHGDLDGGPGNDTIVGGPGADAFMVMPGSGDDVIKDFTAGSGMFDHLALSNLRWAELSFADTATGVRVSWGGGSVLLEGVFKADLAQDDFMFADSPDLPPAARPPTGPTSERPSQSSAGPDIDGAGPNERVDSLADALLRNHRFQFSFSGEEEYRVGIGTMQGDDLVGRSTWDHLFGRDGNDKLVGMDGDDILLGDAGADLLDGGNGHDRLDGGPETDTLSGGAGEDNLDGGDGNDHLDAGEGHDMLNGGMGNDAYVGGAGADAFMVMPDSGHDVVLDFEARGEAQGAFDHVALMDIMPSQVHVNDTTNGALVWWDTDGDDMADGSILLKGVAVADLRQSDFMFNAEPAFVAGVSDVGSWYVFPG
jgi:serralysin